MWLAIAGIWPPLWLRWSSFCHAVLSRRIRHNQYRSGGHGTSGGFIPNPGVCRFRAGGESNPGTTKRDPVALAEAIRSYIEDPQLRLNHGEAGRVRMSETSDQNQFGRAYIRNISGC